MISINDSRAFDGNAVSLGISIEYLMGRAGSALAEVINNRCPEKKVLFICGKGNNGGDGYAAARDIKDSKIMINCDIEDIQSVESKLYYNIVKNSVIPYDLNKIFEFDVIVDCVLGVGAYGILRDDISEYIDRLSQFKGTIISADVPTGFNCNKTVKPHITVTFHDMKEGMTRDNCGEILIRDIGIPSKAVENVGPGDMKRYPIPKKYSHKGNNGRALVIGGGPYFGAPALSSMAALRAGVDTVTIITPENNYKTISSYSPVFIMEQLKGDYLSTSHVKYLLECAQNYDAVLIGPGLGRNPSTVNAIKEFVSKCKTPMVIDADGLKAIGKLTVFSDTPVILTPHSSEFVAIGGEITNDLSTQVNLKAKSSNSVIILKGNKDIISDGTRCRHNVTGNPGMTGGGTGDVLSGIAVALLAKGLPAFDAACLAAFISGEAGDMAFEDHSYGLIATDVVDRIPKVLKKYLQ